MKVSADIQMIPLGVGTSLSPSIAAAIRALESRGLTLRTHAHGTSVEGDLPAVLAAVEDAIEAVHAAGAPRVSTLVKISSRTDREQSDADKVASVTRELGRAPGTPPDA